MKPIVVGKMMRIAVAFVVGTQQPNMMIVAMKMRPSRTLRPLPLVGPIVVAVVAFAFVVDISAIVVAARLD